MKGSFYENRAEQMRAFARRFKSGKASIHEVLKDACICGAAEERFHVLGVLRNGGTTEDICRTPVEEVCGYGKRKLKPQTGGRND